MSFNIGILSGIGEASRERNKNLLTEEANRRQRLSDFWSKRMEDEDLTPEGREVVFNKYLTIAQTPYDKKLPKEVESLDDFLQVRPKSGQSWLGGQTERTVQATPMPIQSQLPQPGQDRSIGSIQAGAVPDAERGTQAPRYQPQPTDFTVPAPAPPSNVTRSPYLSTAEKEAAGERTYRKQQGIQTEEIIKRERAQAQAKKDFYVPSPDRSITPFEEWRRDNPTRPIEDWLKAEQDAKPDTAKSLQESEVILKNGRREMAFFNPDPVKPGWYKKDPTTGKLLDITDQVAGQYRQPQQPSATIQITNAAQPAPGMEPSVSDALNRATMNMQPGRKLQVVNTVNQMFGRGNMQGVKETIRQAAIESEPVAVQQQVRGRREVLTTLAAVQQALAGLPTNILTGTLEDVTRKLGTSTNPEYVKLAGRLRLLNQSYRRSMTGAQFSQAEAAEYASIFPSYSNTAPVNQAQIESLISAFNDNDSVFWDNKLGAGWSDAAVPTVKAPGADREVVEYQGKQYYLVGTDAKGNAILEPVGAKPK